MRRVGQRRPAARAVTAAGFLLIVTLGDAVQSAAAGDPGVQEDIRDIRLPRAQVPAWVWIALPVGGALMLLTAHRLWRRRGGRRTAAATPYEMALRRLEAVRGLMQPAQSDAFSVALSGILRTYVEQAFELTATHRTTEEFLRDLLQSSHAALVLHRGRLADFLGQCDLVKFAGTSLSPEGMETLFQSALAFVTDTAPPSHDPTPAA